jgi:hypothetical protein
MKEILIGIASASGAALIIYLGALIRSVVWFRTAVRSYNV